jgi:Methionine biosynthesis protein MetW
MEWGPLEGLDETGPDRPWMDLKSQPGFRQRSKMIAGIVKLIMILRPGVQTVTDLGCGDGSLLEMLSLGSHAWGYEIGDGDVNHARSRGLDVRAGSIITGDLEYGDLIIVSEVLEHLDDPVAFLRSLPHDRFLVVSSPSRETGSWHNSIHTWAWDLHGYRDVLSRGGWDAIYQTECDGGFNTFAGITSRQCFQAVAALGS